MQLKLVLRYAAPYRAALLCAALFMVGESLITLSVPWLAGQFAQGLLTGSTWGSLSTLQILAILFAVFLCQATCRFFSRYLSTRVGANLLAQLGRRLYDHLQTLPLSYFYQRKRGDLVALLTNDVAVISHFVTGTLLNIIPMALMLFGSFVMMALINVQIALWVAALSPLFWLTFKYLGRRVRPLSAQLMQQQAETVALLEENLGLVSLIKAFVREAVESRRFQRSVESVLLLRLQQLRLQALLGPVVQLLAAVGVLVVLGLSSQQLASGLLTPAELVALLLYGLAFSRPVSAMADLYGQVEQARGGMERLLDIFSVLPEPEDTANQVKLPPVKGEIQFNTIDFGYPNNRMLFEGLNLHIAAGEVVALTGVNGAGKSTLAHLLMRFVEPQMGEIRIDGVDIRTVGLASLRQNIGYVAQHTLLLDGTILDNILYGKPQATLEEVETAAKLAKAHDFILQLPHSYQTSIGEQGARLSGGQRQRIALARVLLINPAILILDEATSMLDPHGEEALLHGCDELFRNKTVIMITHRPATLALADRIVRLEEGRLFEVDV